ncbi:DUF397 domain-containing protein [Streptomyces sp. INA 01156]
MPQDLKWSKSSYSGAEGGDCVEVAVSQGSLHVRDSKAVTGPELTVTLAAWMAFTGFAARHSGRT